MKLFIAIAALVSLVTAVPSVNQQVKRDEIHPYFNPSTPPAQVSFKYFFTPNQTIIIHKRQLTLV